jgi:hypothetical protein
MSTQTEWREIRTHADALAIRPQIEAAYDWLAASRERVTLEDLLDRLEYDDPTLDFGPSMGTPATRRIALILRELKERSR